MSARVYNLLVFGMVLGLAIAFADCGGESPTKGTSGPKDGRVFLLNDTDAIVDVSLKTEQGYSVETVVQPHEKKDISQTVLEGGTKVTVQLKARSSPDDPRYKHFTPTGSVKVTVNGNVTIRLTGPLLFGKDLSPEVNITIIG